MMDLDLILTDQTLFFWICVPAAIVLSVGLFFRYIVWKDARFTKRREPVLLAVLVIALAILIVGSYVQLFSEI